MRWIHISGIAGKTTANLALMYKRAGIFVTGSDANALPPATDLLDQHNLPYVNSFSFEHLTRDFWAEKLALKNLDIPLLPEKVVLARP